MNKALALLKDKLTSGREPYIKSTRTFTELDIARMKRTMRLVERGRDRGQREQPPATSGQLDDIEHEVLNAIATEQRRSKDTFDNEMRTYAQRLSRVDIRGHASDIEINVRDAVSDFMASTKQGLTDLHRAKQQAQEAMEHYLGFKQEHRLRRLAQARSSHVLHIGVLAILFVSEAVLNGTFLARGHDLGLIGGISEAVGIAFINVLVGFGAGRFVVPQLVHRSLLRKLIGLLGTISWSLGALGFNLAVAHYRDALGAVDPDVARSLVLPSIMNQPLTLADFQSWILMGIGSVFSTIAMLGGLFWDDRYPGYGAADRYYSRAVKRYADERSDSLEELAARKEQVVNDLKGLQRDIRNRRSEHESALAARNRLRQAFAAHLDHLQFGLQDLLATYRQANSQSRTTSIPPHFAETSMLPRPEIPPNDDWDTSGSDVMQTATRLDQVLGSAINTLFSTYDREVASFPGVDDLKMPEAGRG